MFRASTQPLLASLSPSKSCPPGPTSQLTNGWTLSLPEHKDDRALEAAVTREFSKYGTVFVKIRRDSNHMPFAFCQFTVSSQRRR